MTSSRCVCTVMLVAVALLSGCTEKKPPEPAKPVEAPKPPPPPPRENEPRALKECAAPLDTGLATEVKIGERGAKQTGYKLTFPQKDADGALVLGVLGPVNEDSGMNLLVLKRYLKFFADEKVDAIVVTGDVGEVADGIARVLRELATAKVPVLAVIGNRECRAEFTDGILAARKDASNVVNLSEIRAVEFPEATLVTLPGYHDPNFMACANGCQYFKSTVDEVVRLAKDATSPVILVSHGPPHGETNNALDFATSGGNVGDKEINRALKDGAIPFGLFSNIKEAGGRATADAAGASLLKEGVASKSLFLNPGPADTVGWELNDNTRSEGMAATFTLKGGEASYKIYRSKPLTKAEKAEASKLDPPKREEKKEAPVAPKP